MQVRHRLLRDVWNHVVRKRQQEGPGRLCSKALTLYVILKRPALPCRRTVVLFVGPDFLCHPEAPVGFPSPDCPSLKILWLGVKIFL